MIGDERSRSRSPRRDGLSQVAEQEAEPMADHGGDEAEAGEGGEAGEAGKSTLAVIAGEETMAEGGKALPEAAAQGAGNNVASGSKSKKNKANRKPRKRNAPNKSGPEHTEQKTEKVAMSAATGGAGKYTCRFLIGIENDKDFKVARRIIGPTGSNMKNIVKQTDAKLRLRGQGSGYHEAGGKESPEPLQLCISCQSLNGYRKAVAAADALLRRVHDEYRDFCRENGRPSPPLQMDISENKPGTACLGHPVPPATVPYHHPSYPMYSSYPAYTHPPPHLAHGYPLGYAGYPHPHYPPPTHHHLPPPVYPGYPPPVYPGYGPPPAYGHPHPQHCAPPGPAAGYPPPGEDRGAPRPGAPAILQIEASIDQRNAARKSGNYREADRLRDELFSSGVVLMDEPGGRGRGKEVTKWRYWNE